MILIYLAWRVNPSQMTEMRVSGNTDNLRVESFKFLNSVAEGDDLRWAHKSTANEHCVNSLGIKIHVPKLM